MAGMLALLSSSSLAARERALPPEPSYEAWVSPAAEQQMVEAIAYYRRIVTAGGWPRLPDRITLRPGDSGSEVATVRRRLEVYREQTAPLVAFYEASGAPFERIRADRGVDEVYADFLGAVEAQR